MEPLTWSIELGSHNLMEGIATAQNNSLLTRNIPTLQDMSICETKESFPTSQKLQRILNNLTEEELEVAARSSYEYFRDPSKQNCRRSYAEKYASRFLESASMDEIKALTKLKANLQFRKEVDIDGLRLAFENPMSDYQKPLRNFFASKKSYVQGYDIEGRSTYVFVPRHVLDHDPEWTVKGHIWTLEKAMACTRSQDGTINAVVDFNGFSVYHNSPPTHLGKEIMSTLRNHYVGAINQIYLVDAPSAFLCLWAIFKPFAGRKTRDKINFVSSQKEKKSVLGKLYTPQEAAPWMLPEGRKSRELDVDEYLFQTPFDRAFDE